MNEHIVDQIPAYCLGTLSKEEVEVVEEHLRSCSACRSEWLLMQETVGEMAYMPEPQDPPAHIKQSVMREIAKTHHAATDQDKHGSDWRSKLRKMISPLANPVWGAAGLLVIFALLVSNLVLWNQTRQAQSATRFETVRMFGTEAAENAHGVLVISDNGMHGTLIVDGLQPLSVEHQYQLWLIQNGDRTDGGVFSVDEVGYGALYIDSPLPLISYQEFCVTIEPSGGSMAPTGNKVLGGSF